MNTNYQIIRIQRYIGGELSLEEMYQLEREALDDPLLQDAIDGYREKNEVSHRQLSLLQQRLATRIAGQAAERNAFFFGWQRLAVAATACVLMVLGLVLLWMRNHTEPSNVAEKQVEVELPPLTGISHIQVAVITGNGLNAQPEGGRQQLEAYLNAHKHMVSGKGKVTLTFGIDSRGKPEGIHSVGKVDAVLLNEIKQLLENGPRWEGTKAKINLSFE